MPRVSVVITAFNAGPLIAATLDSIVTQSYRDFEVIVVDGGSTDRTVEVVSGYPSPVRLIAGERLSKSAGRNTGIRSARGDYIAFVDADDLWLPQKLGRQVDYLKSSPSLQWVYSDCFILDEGKTNARSTWSRRTPLQSGRILQPLLFDCIVPSPTPVIRRGVFEAVGLFDESFLRHEPEDWDMWLRVAARFPVGVIREPLAQLRVHTGSLTAQEDALLAAEGVMSVALRALDRNQDLPGRVRRQVLAKWYGRLGRGLAGRGLAPEARAFLVHAIQQNPRTLVPYLLWSSTWAGCSISRHLHKIHRALRRV